MFGHEEAVCKMGTTFSHCRSQKRARVAASEKCLGMFQRNSKGFLRRYVTADEAWIHYTGLQIMDLYLLLENERPFPE